MESYTCKICKVLKPKDNFSRSAIENRDCRCKPCYNESKRLNRHKNLKAWIWTRARMRAKTAKVSFAITIDDIYIPKYCPLLNIRLRSSYNKGGTRTNSPSLDRIYPQYGYVPGNIIVISFAANTFKNNATPEQLTLLATNLQNIVTNHYPLQIKDMKQLWPEEYKYDFLQSDEEKEQGEEAAGGGGNAGGGNIPIPNR
jgi:hypothetical protein